MKLYESIKNKKNFNKNLKYNHNFVFCFLFKLNSILNNYN